MARFSLCAQCGQKPRQIREFCIDCANRLDRQDPSVCGMCNNYTRPCLQCQNCKSWVCVDCIPMHHDWKPAHGAPPIFASGQRMRIELCRCGHYEIVRRNNSPAHPSVPYCNTCLGSGQSINKSTNKCNRCERPVRSSLTLRGFIQPSQCRISAPEEPGGCCNAVLCEDCFRQKPYCIFCECDRMNGIDTLSPRRR